MSNESLTEASFSNKKNAWFNDQISSISFINKKYSLW